ncbi:hypothetical protein AMEX_G13794 [Astyanax mexicanus]|uniref:Uncharacterized protein n=1 Tax=Astyanax mexicanus TaxID=7994 RepID=A0A8T2LSF2_ASTMX|nr:hypothetical protein AMEX_G13794 [Astyanax mexicanus]
MVSTWTHTLRPAKTPAWAEISKFRRNMKIVKSAFLSRENPPSPAPWLLPLRIATPPYPLLSTVWVTGSGQGDSYKVKKAVKLQQNHVQQNAPSLSHSHRLSSRRSRAQRERVYSILFYSILHLSHIPVVTLLFFPKQKTEKKRIFISPEHQALSIQSVSWVWTMVLYMPEVLAAVSRDSGRSRESLESWGSRPKMGDVWGFITA